MELFFGWIIFSAVVGFVASTRGRSGIGWFFLALLISPIISGIALAFIPNLKEEATRAAERDEARRLSEVARQEAESRTKHEAARISGPDMALALEKLRQLREKSMITDVEFVARKQKLLLDLRDRVITQGPEDFLASLIPLVENGTLDQKDVAAIKQIVFR